MADWFDGGGAHSPVDIPAMFDSEAATILLGIVAAGALVSLGLTSDGGALGVTVTVDGRWRREYFRDSEELTVWLKEAEEAVATAARPSPASSAGRPRQRSRRGA
jgi:hypothetical protein